MTNGPDSPHSGPVTEGPFDHQPGGFMGNRNRTGEVARAGITMGTALAIAISWSLHQSILWAIVHGFFSWLYVIYYAFTR
jgi:hypothetical protein